MSVTATSLPTQETHPQPRSGPRPMTCLPLGDDQYRVSSGRYERAESTYDCDMLLQSCSCLDWQLYGGPERSGRAGYPLDHPDRLCKHLRHVYLTQQRAAALGSQQPTPAQIVSAAAPILAAPLPVRGALAVIRDRNRRISRMCYGDDDE